MSKYLLDTHTLLWMQDDSAMLSDKSKKILSNSSNELSVSIASFWEIVIKISLGKLTIKYTIDELFDACATNSIIVLPIHLAQLTTLSTLPFLHRDPFDRMIIATGISHNLSIITKDQYINQYQVKVIW